MAFFYCSFSLFVFQVVPGLNNVGDAALVKPLQGWDQFCWLDHWTTPATTATPLPSTINTFVYIQPLSRLQAAARVTFDMSLTSAILVLLEIDLFFSKIKDLYEI